MKIAGKEVSNWWLIGGGAGVVLIIYLFRKGGKGGTGTTAATDPNATDPATGLPYSMDSQVDPATGLTYLQEAQQYGSVQAAQAAVTGGGYGGYGGYGGTAGYPTPGGPYPPGTTSAYASNAQWAQAAQAGLAALGYDPVTVAAALGAFLAGKPLTPDQASIVQAAEAEFGLPPVGNFPVVTQGNGGGGGGGGGAATVEVPDVVGLDQAQAFQILQSLGLKVHGSPVQRGKTLTVDHQSPAAKKEVDPGSTVTLTSSVHRQSSGGGGTPPPGTDTITVPNVIGMTQERAFSVLSADGFHPTGPAPVRGRTHIVTAQSPKAGTRVPIGAVIHLSSRLQ